MSTQRHLDLDSVHNIAMQAQYLFQGMGPTYSLLQEQEGHVATTHRIGELAVVVHDFLQTPRMLQVNEEASWPGVFEYEVVEELGAWFGNHSRCTDAEFLAELERVTFQWLGETQGAGANTPG